MDVELLLFLIVGGISVFAAVMMLLDDNPVQSALFLILNLGCVAFLFLMLDAGFLAMVQVAVYAGAIMVLFLFVIMLLGAEKEISGDTPPRSLWIAITALALAVIFTVLLAGYAADNTGELEAREKPAGPALARIAHAAPEAASRVSVFLNGDALTESVRFRAFSDYVEVPAGEYEVSVGPAGGDASEATAVASVTLESETATTLVAYNDGDALVIDAVPEDLSLIEDAGEGRLVVFNTYPAVDSASLVQIDSDFRFADAADAQSAKVYAGNIAYGTASDALTLGSGELRAVFIPDVEGSEDEIITRLHDFEIEEDSSTFVILGLDAEAGNLPTTSISVTPAAVQFGGPESVGEALFTGYVLPLEAVAVLLLAAMVGAIVLTQRVDLKPKPGRPTRRRVSRPLTSVISSQTGHTVEDAGTELDVVEEPSGD